MPIGSVDLDVKFYSNTFEHIQNLDITMKQIIRF